MENNDDFLGTYGCRKDTPYKIYISSSAILKSEIPDFLNPDASYPRCVRCGSEMKGFQSVFVTIYPPLAQPKSNQSNASSDSVYSKKSLSNPFHISKKSVIINSDDSASSDRNCISLININPDSKVSCPSCKNIIDLSCINHRSSVNCASNTDYDNHNSNDSYESSSEHNSLQSVSSCSDSCSCKFHTPRSSLVSGSNDESSDRTSTDITKDSIGSESMYSQCGDSSNDSVSDVDSPKYDIPENTAWNERPRKFEILTDTSSTPCKDCHVAVADTRSDTNDGLEIVSLMFQISNNTDYMQALQWDYDRPLSSKVSVGVSVNSLGFFPDITVDSESDAGVKLPGPKGVYPLPLPDLNPEAEAAYQSHLRTLVPCDFCGRTFNPDRVMVHQRACIERPSKRKKPSGK